MSSIPFDNGIRKGIGKFSIVYQFTYFFANLGKIGILLPIQFSQ